jgi:hypothetical protein
VSRSASDIPLHQQLLYASPGESSPDASPTRLLTSRRSLLSAAATFLIVVPAAGAAEDSAKVVATKNKRLGGLANKIRGIGNIMVSL